MLNIINKQAEGELLASVEVYFNSKPTKEVTNLLKKNNFRFTCKGGKHWWAYTNQFTNQILRELEELNKANEVDFIDPVEFELPKTIENETAKTKSKQGSYPALVGNREFELKGKNQDITKDFKYKPIFDVNKGNDRVKIIYCDKSYFTLTTICDVIKLSLDCVVEWVKEWNKWRKNKQGFKRVKDLKKIEWVGFTEIAVVDAFGLISVTKKNLKDFIKQYSNFKVIKFEKVGTLILMQLDKRVSSSFDLAT